MSSDASLSDCWQLLIEQRAAEMSPAERGEVEYRSWIHLLRLQAPFTAPHVQFAENRNDDFDTAGRYKYYARNYRSTP